MEGVPYISIFKYKEQSLILILRRGNDDPDELQIIKKDMYYIRTHNVRISAHTYAK